MMSTPRVPRDEDLDMFAEEGATLAECEEQWQGEDMWMHDLSTIIQEVRDASASGDTEQLVIWLAAVECHWRGHSEYPILRDALLSRLGRVQSDTERPIAEHRDMIRHRFAAQDWTDRQLGELLLREV